MSNNIGDFFIEFGKYAVDKYNKNTKYKNALQEFMYSSDVDDLMNKMSKKGECDFLNTNTINNKIETEINEHIKILHQNDTNPQKIYDNMLELIDNIKIKEYVNNEFNVGKFILESIMNTFNKTVDELTIGDLRKFCYFAIYKDYFEVKFGEFLDNNYEGDDKTKNDKTQKFINDASEISRRASDNNIEENIYGNERVIRHFKSEMYPYSFLAKNETIQIRYDENIKKFRAEKKSDLSFESTMVLTTPNIQIFCSGPINSNNHVQFSFNRFTFYHEMGHGLLNYNKDFNFKFNDKIYNVISNKDTFKYIKNNINFTDKEHDIFIKKLDFGLMFGITNNTTDTVISSAAISDIVSDMLATLSLIKELQNLEMKMQQRHLILRLMLIIN